MGFNEARKLKIPAQKVKKQIPRIVDTMLTEGRNFFEGNFRKQGFDDTTVQRWQPRKRTHYRTRSGKVVDDRNRAILVKTGRLKRSLRKKRISSFAGIIFSEVPYANIHNDGLTGRAFGRYMFKMPKRQFVGHSNKLNKKLRLIIERKINVIFA